LVFKFSISGMREVRRLNAEMSRLSGMWTARKKIIADKVWILLIASA
jgi:hypothetical protein